MKTAAEILAQMSPEDQDKIASRANELIVAEQSTRSLSALLGDIGVHHEPSKIEGKHDLYNLVGGHIGTFDAKEAFEYLEEYRRTMRRFRPPASPDEIEVFCTGHVEP